MPQPDFEQIAREILHHLFDLQGGPAIIAEQLRLVWNARGAADIVQVDATLAGMHSSLYAKHVDQAIRSLDVESRASGRCEGWYPVP